MVVVSLFAKVTIVVVSFAVGAPLIVSAMVRVVTPASDMLVLSLVVTLKLDALVEANKVARWKVRIKVTFQVKDELHE